MITHASQASETALPDDPEILKQMVMESCRNRSAAKDSELRLLREENRLLKYGKFSPKADKLTDEQLGLVRRRTGVSLRGCRQKRPTNPRSRDRKPTRPLSDKLPREERVHDIPEAEKVCACGVELSEIGRETAERLEVIPPSVQGGRRCATEICL